jgi:hypothetical protein
MRVVVEFTVVVTEEDVEWALWKRERPKNWEGFLSYVQSNLQDAVCDYLMDEIGFFAEVYEEMEEEEEEQGSPSR